MFNKYFDITKDAIGSPGCCLATIRSRQGCYVRLNLEIKVQVSLCKVMLLQVQYIFTIPKTELKVEKYDSLKRSFQ